MKNRFFLKMQRKGITYRKQIAPASISSFNRLFSEGASLAFKYWAISERYNATDIFIDVFPDDETTKEMINTFKAAGVNTIVISIDCEYMIKDLEKLGCRLVGKCKVFRRETELYYGHLEILQGYRVDLKWVHFG